MLLADGAVGIALTLLWVYCILEAITADETAVRNLPKIAWILLVIFLLDVGSLLWLVAGRPQGATRSLPRRGVTPPEYDRPGRATAASPDDDAAFLAGLRSRAQEQRDRAAEQARQLRRDEDS